MSKFYTFAIEKTYGSLKELVEKYDIPIGTLDTYKWVASQYEIPNRLGSLTYKHHQIAAAEDDRLEWLAKAETEISNRQILPFSFSANNEVLQKEVNHERIDL
jgi:hypothetical protein